MIITISGVAGSGKSTVAKLIAKKLGYKHYSMGDLQRKYALEKGITIEELGRQEAKDDSIDKEVDAYQTKLAEKEDNFVIDSWLGFYFIPKAFKIFLKCSDEEAAKRIFKAVKKGERNKSERKTENIEKQIQINKERRETNRKRWKKYYGIDFMDTKNYDLIVDTTPIPAVKVAEKILKTL